MAKTAKKEAWEWCSKYIRLRDAIQYQKDNPESPFGYVQCCTCERIIIWDKNADAGHFVRRGSGGMSGVYFDERNINTQCKPCNGFEGGRPEIYELFMKAKYGQEVIDELRWLDKNQSYKKKIIGIGLMYKQMYKELCEKI